MIKFEYEEISGIQAALRGMRNPFNSWDNSDSKQFGEDFEIGYNDYALALNLIQAGDDHSKFMRFITVSVDITAPLYFWKQFDTYKVGTVRNSCSTMHMLAKRQFMWSDFSTDGMTQLGKNALFNTMGYLNKFQAEYAKTQNKNVWRDMVNNLPECYNQRATVFLNYATLRHIYKARKDHKLAEWRVFCGWIERLPYSDFITKKQ